MTMFDEAAVHRSRQGMEIASKCKTGSLFRGLSLSFLGFDTESLQAASVYAATASPFTCYDASDSSSKVFDDAQKSRTNGGGRADAEAACALLRRMEDMASAVSFPCRRNRQRRMFSGSFVSVSRGYAF